MNAEVFSPVRWMGCRTKADLPQQRWPRDKVLVLFERPFMDLIFEAQQVHRQYFNPSEIQLSTLLSIKTGGCAENCGYCSQSAHHDTKVKATKLMPLEQVVEAAKAARAKGASRFCMGAAWRSPKTRDMGAVLAMVREVKRLGMETCMTLGMLTAEQAQQLRDAGLDYYNHNLDSDPDYYGTVVSTRGYDDRLETLEHVRDAGIHVCSGGIVGMGESRLHRAGLIAALANLDPYPESVPINNLVPIEGTPLGDSEAIDPFEFIRTIAVARITMPRSRVRLSAGREQMNDAQQALCFMAGANSIFYGEELLTTSNTSAERDLALLQRLDMTSETRVEAASE